MEEATQINKTAQGRPGSYFDGGVFQYLGWGILSALVSFFTLGICSHFAITWICAWEMKHTVIDGRRLKFTGTARGLFGTWIVSLLLCIVTLGIYGLWVPIKIMKWRDANTFFEDEVPTFDAEQRLREEKASYFDGGLLQLIGVSILGSIVWSISLGICYPWAVDMFCSWEQEHKVYCKRRCTFNGRAVELFGTWIVCILLTLITLGVGRLELFGTWTWIVSLLLCIVTLGIYSLWLPIRIQRWKVKHTHLLPGCK